MLPSGNQIEESYINNIQIHDDFDNHVNKKRRRTDSKQEGIRQEEDLVWEGAENNEGTTAIRHLFELVAEILEGTISTSHLLVVIQQ